MKGYMFKIKQKSLNGRRSDMEGKNTHVKVTEIRENTVALFKFLMYSLPVYYIGSIQDVMDGFEMLYIQIVIFSQNAQL